MHKKMMTDTKKYDTFIADTKSEDILCTKIQWTQKVRTFCAQNKVDTKSVDISCTKIKQIQKVWTLKN